MYTMRYLADLALRPHTSIVSIKTLILVQLRLIGSDTCKVNMNIVGYIAICELDQYYALYASAAINCSNGVSFIILKRCI